jgi:hypothetical protein
VHVQRGPDVHGCGDNVSGLGVLRHMPDRYSRLRVRVGHDAVPERRMLRLRRLGSLLHEWLQLAGVLLSGKHACDLRCRTQRLPAADARRGLQRQHADVLRRRVYRGGVRRRRRSVRYRPLLHGRYLCGVERYELPGHNGTMRRLHDACWCTGARFRVHRQRLRMHEQCGLHVIRAGGALRGRRWRRLRVQQH